MKKVLRIYPLLSLLLLAEGFEYKGNIGFEGAYINHSLSNKEDNQIAFRGEIEFQQKFSSSKVVFGAKSIIDIADKERRYIEVTDAYYKYNFENSDILIGRKTNFWGAMEFYNHTDNFNTKDFRDDPFDYDSKLGAWNLAYTYYFENSELSFIAKVHQEEQKPQGEKSVNNFFPSSYEGDLETQSNLDRPSLYMKYSGSAEEVQLDYNLIYENGYDEQRYFIFDKKEFKLKQHAYIVNKLMGYATYVNGETIYKTEVAITQNQDTTVSDYAQLSFGVEHTFYGIAGKSDLGLLAEYYRYEMFDDTKKNSKNIKNLFANDMMLGFRATLNDGKDSAVLGGLAIDIDNKEKIFFVDYDTRVYDSYKLNLSYQHLAPKSDSVFSKLDRLSLTLGYYF